MKFTILVSSVWLLGTAIFARGGPVTELTSKTFEHDTQASTGATTGDWFVKFYAQWCGYCKRLEPVWEQLAEELHQEVNVAKVDVIANRELGDRFEVKGFPTLILFSKGMMYRYNGDKSLEDLKAFATGGFKNTVEPIVVPKEFGVLRKFFYKLPSEIHNVSRDLPTVVKRFPYVALLLASTGLTTGLVVGATTVLVVGMMSKVNGQKQSAPASLSRSTSATGVTTRSKKHN